MHAASRTATPPILAVIPCLNEIAHIDKLVRSLAAAPQPPLLIVIADGGSTDGTVAAAQRLAAEFPNVRYLRNPKRIQSAAVNLAVTTFGAGLNLLLRLDAHADYPPEFARILVEDLAATGADFVVVAMDTAGKSFFQRVAAAAQNSALGNGAAAHRRVRGPGGWIDHGHHALMRLEAFRAVGGYDESFSHNEDAELDLRLRRAGYRIWLTGRTGLTYYPRTKPSLLFRQYFRFGQGRARTLIKHRATPRLRQTLPLAVPPALLLALAAPLAWQAALPSALWAVACLSYGLALGVRQRSAAAALSGVAAMVMHLGWSLGFGSGLVSALRRPS